MRNELRWWELSSYIHGCQPGNNMHRLLGSVASCMRWFTCPLTLSGTPSSIPSSFSCNLIKTLSAILFKSEFWPLLVPALIVSKISPALLTDVSSWSGRCCKLRALWGLSVHWYSGSWSKTYHTKDIKQEVHTLLLHTEAMPHVILKHLSCLANNEELEKANISYTLGCK